MDQPLLTQLDVMGALNLVIDPELNMSLVELALITAVGIEAKRVLVITKLTTPFCPYIPAIFADMSRSCQRCSSPALVAGPLMTPKISLRGLTCGILGDGRLRVLCHDSALV